VGATLFVIAASNASLAGRLALDLKRIEYRLVELPPITHRPIMRLLRFPGYTVPALLVDGERIQGTRQIVRALDRLRPDPPLLPADHEVRARVEEVERWGEAELQPVLRWIQPWAVLQRPAAVASFADRIRIPVPASVQGRMMLPNVRIAARRNPSNERVVREVLARLPAMLDRIDGWMADGVIGGDQPNAGDIQVASTLRMLLVYDDLAPAIRDRPGGRLALRLLPDVPGHMPPVFPPDALGPLRGQRLGAG